MERGTKKSKPMNKEQKEIERMVQEIDETNFFAAFITRGKALFGKCLIQGIFSGIGGAITTIVLKRAFGVNES